MAKANVTFPSNPYPDPKSGSVPKKAVSMKGEYVGIKSVNPLLGIGEDSRAQVSDNQSGKNRLGITVDKGVKVDEGRRKQTMGAGG